jgi:hypothetical protein
MGVFRSGAFLQQCFSVHPLTLNVRLVTPPDLVGIVCTHCRMKHRVTVRQALPQELEKVKNHDEGMLSLHRCSTMHPEDIRISLVDVVNDSVECRCRPCRRTYLLDVELIETHQS